MKLCVKDSLLTFMILSFIFILYRNSTISLQVEKGKISGEMKAIENLKRFLEEAEQSEPILSREQIEILGNDLIQAAKDRKGYEELIWQAGTNLLLYTNFDEEFYRRFGYQVVANALYYTFVNRDFPLGLGFIVHDFLPPGVGLSELSSHQAIHQAIDLLQKEQIKVTAQNFADATPRLREASVQFLRQGKAFGLSSSLCLQIASSLFQATQGNNQEHEAALKLFLEVLSVDQRDINLFYCWRASIDMYRSLGSETSYLSLLPKIMKISRNLSDGGRGVLAQIFSDEPLIKNAPQSESLLLLLGLAGWWLYVYADHQRQGVSMAWQFIWTIEKTFPTLHKILRAYLEEDQLSGKALEEIEDLQQDFHECMQRLPSEFRQRSYHGVPLATKIYHHNLVSLFVPLYEALGDSSTLPQDVIETIQTLDGYKLLDENPVQREARFQIEGKLRLNMIKDFEEIIAIFREAQELRQKISNSLTSSPEVAISLDGNDAKQEIDTLSRQYPDLQWAIEWFLAKAAVAPEGEQA